MNIDTLRAKAEAAKAWVSTLACDSMSHGGPDGCACCDGAWLAMEDIAREVDEAVENSESRDDGGSLASDMGAVEDACAAIGCAERAARIASYFAAEPNPVSIFRDAVKEMCK